MATRSDQRDPIVEWFGDGSPGWIATLTWVATWLAWTALLAVAASFGDEPLRWSQILGVNVFFFGIAFPVVAVPVLVIDAVVAHLGRRRGWRVGEVMVAVPVIWTVGCTIGWILLT